jgi:nicotinamide-nucleotide amidase
MKAEIIAVGTELLLGQISNTNAQFISQQCAGIGVDIYYQTVVGDNRDRIKRAFDIARERADVIICTGGLGPTQDDLTKDVLADYTGRKLILHEPSMQAIRQLFESRGIHMVKSNERQALMLEGSDPLTNTTGLAVGNALTYEGTHFILLPGPPREMKPMFTQYAVPWLRSVMKDEQPLYSIMLKFAGIGESTLEHELLDLIEGQKDPTIAPYAKEGEVTIRLTTRAASEEAAQAKLRGARAAVEARVGNHLYADEDIPIEKVIVEQLLAAGCTLSVAESCTGGMLSDLLTMIPGSSNAFRGGVVTYTNIVKHRILGIPLEQLEGDGAPGAVSDETARLMAERVLALTGSDYALSVTGVAGPGESEGKPVGLVYIALAQAGRETEAWTTKQSGGRELIKLKSAKHALYQLWKRLANREEGTV